MNLIWEAPESDYITKVDILDEEFEIPTNLTDLAKVIEYAFEAAPKDKRTTLYKEWRDKTNLLVQTYNRKTKFKTFIGMF